MRLVALFLDCVKYFHNSLKDFSFMLAKSYIVNFFTIMREGGLQEKSSLLLVAARESVNQLYAVFVKRVRIVSLSAVISMNAKIWQMS